MKKLFLLALLPLTIACNKSSNVNVGPDTNSQTPAMKQAGTATTFTTSQNLVGLANNGKENYTGSFTASGLVNGTGTTAEVVNVTWPSSGSSTAVSNATFTFTSTQTFTFADGSITIQTSGTWWITSPTSGAGAGTWIVISSTGNYAGIKGSGTLTISEILFGVSVTDTYTGDLRY